MTRKQEYEIYMKSPQWKVLRRLALERFDNRCALCDGGKNLHVHHRKYPEKFGDEELTMLTVLCARCHKIHHDNNTNNKHTKVQPKKKRSRPSKGVRNRANRSGKVEVFTSEQIQKENEARQEVWIRRRKISV